MDKKVKYQKSNNNLYHWHKSPCRKTTFTAWKVSKYGVISGPYFPVFGLNTGKYGPELTPYLDTLSRSVCIMNLLVIEFLLVLFPIYHSRVVCDAWGNIAEGNQNRLNSQR